MHKSVTVSLVAALFAAIASSGLHAQTIPALQGLSAPEQAKVSQLIEAARKEGSLSYWDAIIQPDTNDALETAFRKYYGLPSSFKVSYTLSSTANLVTRVDQEVGAKRVTIDVAAVAAPTWLYERITAGDILEYDSTQSRHYASVFENGMGQKGFFIISGAYQFLPMWSEDHLKFTGKSWKDVLTAAMAGRISIGDVTKSTSYLGTYAGLRQVLGLDFYRELAKLKPSLLVRSELVAGRLVTGEDLMTTSGQPTRALQNNERGAKLKFLFPDEGVVLMPHCQFILAGAPHPNAAKLWVDFMLSEEGQQILVRKEALSSGRAGFKSPVPDYAPPIENIKAIKVDWKSMNTQTLQKIREEWVSIFNP